MDQSKLISQEEKKEAKDHQPGLCWSSHRPCPGGRGTGRTLRRWGTPWARVIVPQIVRKIMIEYTLWGRGYDNVNDRNDSLIFNYSIRTLR